MGTASAIPGNLVSYSTAGVQRDVDVSYWVRTVLGQAVTQYRSGAIDYGHSIKHLTAGERIDVPADMALRRAAITDKFAGRVGADFQKAGNEGAKVTSAVPMLTEAPRNPFLPMLYDWNRVVVRTDDDTLAKMNPAFNQQTQDALKALLAKYKPGTQNYNLAVKLKRYIEVLFGGSDGLFDDPVAGAADLARQGEPTYQGDNIRLLLREWAFAPYEQKLFFNDHDELTKRLQVDPSLNPLYAMLRTQVVGGDYQVPLTRMGGDFQYVDPANPKSFVLDNLGMFTNGYVGRPLPSAFLGSYNVVYQVIDQNRDNKTYTVSFIAYNRTGVHSLTHFAPDRTEGPGANLDQWYMWTQTFSTR